MGIDYTNMIYLINEMSKMSFLYMLRYDIKVTYLLTWGLGVKESFVGGWTLILTFSDSIHHHRQHPHCAAIVPRGGAKSQHAASTSAYLALSSARWYPTSNRLVLFSTVSPAFF